MCFPNELTVSASPLIATNVTLSFFGTTLHGGQSCAERRFCFLILAAPMQYRSQSLFGTERVSMLKAKHSPFVSGIADDEFVIF